METHVITIARQFGSLGRLIGKTIANKLNFKYYDRDILEQTAKIMNVSLAFLTELDEKGISGYGKMAYPLGIGSGVTQDKMFDVQSELIRKYAQTENCIIIGRCSDYILREYSNVLSCYIYAPYLKRVANSVDELGIKAAEVNVIVDKVDKGRADYYRHYTGCEYNTTYFRDLLIDSSLLGVEGTAELITNVAKSKFK